MKHQYFHRMELRGKTRAQSLPKEVVICNYNRERHHNLIPTLYAKAFAEPLWSTDWDCFPEFDARGVFVAQIHATSEVVGFVISFKRKDFGYVSVLAVVPSHQRRGIGGALVQAAIVYLRSLGLKTIQVDAFTDDVLAVRFYQDFGFRVIRTYKNNEN